jgi:hypothetical protein
MTLHQTLHSNEESRSCLLHDTTPTQVHSPLQQVRVRVQASPQQHQLT